MVVGNCTNICVLYTVADARFRDYAVEVPADCVATFDPEAHAFALKQMETVLGAATAAARGPSRDVDNFHNPARMALTACLSLHSRRLFEQTLARRRRAGRRPDSGRPRKCLGRRTADQRRI